MGQTGMRSGFSSFIPGGMNMQRLWGGERTCENMPNKISCALAPTDVQSLEPESQDTGIGRTEEEKVCLRSSLETWKSVGTGRERRSRGKVGERDFLTQMEAHNDEDSNRKEKPMWVAPGPPFFLKIFTDIVNFTYYINKIINHVRVQRLRHFPWTGWTQIWFQAPHYPNPSTTECSKNIFLIKEKKKENQGKEERSSLLGAAQVQFQVPHMVHST